MRILQVIPSLALGFGGPTKAVLTFSFALARLGQDVTIFSTDADIKGRLAVPLKMPINIQNVKVFYFPVQYPRHYKFSLSLAQALRKDIPQFDIVHIHSLFQFSTLAASYYCRKYRKPYIIRPLGQLDPFVLRRHSFCKRLYLWFFEHGNLERASALHFTTDEERRLTEKMNLKNKNIVLEMGVDLSEFETLPRYGTFRAKYPILKDKKIILFLSRINFKKGLDILVKAFADIARKREDVYLVIAGPDNEGYSRRVKGWLAKEEMLNRVIFTGMLVGQDKLAVFKDSDLFVLPSYSENFGMAVIEAMACGIPVVISNKVGIYREIQENNSGVVVECQEGSLCEGIRSILDNENFAQELSSKGKKMVAEYYNIDRVAYKMIESYKEILKVT